MNIPRISFEFHPNDNTRIFGIKEEYLRGKGAIVMGFTDIILENFSPLHLGSSLNTSVISESPRI